MSLAAKHERPPIGRKRGATNTRFRFDLRYLSASRCVAEFYGARHSAQQNLPAIG